MRNVLTGTCALMLLGIGALFVVSDPTPARVHAAPTDAPNRSARVDSELAKVWKRDGVKPTARCDDHAFVRRVYLDLVSELPTRDETVAFVSDKSANKRSALIDKLLADPRFGEAQADRWIETFGIRGTEFGELGRSIVDWLALWLADQINANRPFDQIIRDMLLANGKMSDNPASAYFVAMGIPLRTARAAGLTSKHFTGVQIQCAECHDHPFDDDWKQSTFQGVASFLVPIVVDADFYIQPLDPRVKTDEIPPRAALKQYLRENPDLPAEFRGRVDDIFTYDAPKLPDDRAVKTRNKPIWRRIYSNWILKRAPEYLANRVFSFLFGQGLLTPEDDFSVLNDPSHPELLAYLGASFAESRFDLKRLYRDLMNTRAYQLSAANPDPKALPWQFAHAPVRQLSSHQFFGALLSMSDDDGVIKGFHRSAISEYERANTYRSMLKMQKEKNPDAPKFNDKLLNLYVKRFRDVRPAWKVRRHLAWSYSAATSDDEANASEGFVLSVPQALNALNGELTRRLSDSRKGALVYNVMQSSDDTDTRIENMFLSVLSRKPTKTEREACREIIATAKTPHAGFEDLFFVLVSTTEFATNH